MKALKILSFLAFVVLALTSGQALAQEPVKIGVYLPLTGQMGYGGRLELEGVALAAEEKPEVLGRPVQLIIKDSQSEKVEASVSVKRLIDHDGVVALIGSYGSTLAIAGGEVSEEAKIPTIGTSATSPLVTQGRKYYFRHCFTDPYQSAGAAVYAYEHLGARTAAVLPDVSSDMAVGLNAFFKRAFTGLGGKIVAEMHCRAGDRDFTRQLIEIMAKEPDVLFIPAYFPEGVIILKQARELGAEFHLLAGDSMDNPELVTIAGPAAEGFIHTTFPYDPAMSDPSPEAAAFTNLWRSARPDREPHVSAAIGYTSYLLLAEAIERAGRAEPEAIAMALANIEDFKTPLGALTPGPEDNPRMAIGLIEIINGRRTYLGEIRPE